MKGLLARAVAAAAAGTAQAAAGAAQAAVAACEAMQESSFPAGAIAGVAAVVAVAPALPADWLQSHAAAPHIVGYRTTWGCTEQVVCPALGPWAATVEQRGARAGEGWEAAAACKPAKLESVNGGKCMGGA